jgi:hypothetical protein
MIERKGGLKVLNLPNAGRNGQIDGKIETEMEKETGIKREREMGR